MVTSAARNPTRHRPRLVLVANNPKPSSRWQGTDPIFFHRSQVKIGTRIMNFGRISHGQMWVVTEIFTWTPDGKGNLVRTPVSQVERLSDDIVLRTTITPHQFRKTTFSTLSYSSIWRLA